MRIGIVGAGAIGSAYAARLLAAGVDVQVASRSASTLGTADAGIRFRDASGDRIIQPELVGVLSGTFDAILVTTKAHDTEVAVTATAAGASSQVWVLVQNGVAREDRFSAAAPNATWLGGLAMIAAEHVAQAQVTVTAEGPLFVGSRTATTADLARTAALLSALDARVIERFEAAQWGKLLVNHLNALPAITGLSVQQIVASDHLRKYLLRTMHETMRTADAAGVEVDPIGVLTEQHLALLRRRVTRATDAVAFDLTRYMGEVPNLGSTQQSLRRGRTTEIDDLNGAVVRLGRGIGRATPYNARTVELVHAVERLGHPIPADAVQLNPREPSRGVVA